MFDRLTSGTTVKNRVTSPAEITALTEELLREIGAPAPVRPVGPLGFLVSSNGGPSLVLRKESLVIGRSETCDLPLTDRRVSTRHARISALSFAPYW